MHKMIPNNPVGNRSVLSKSFSQQHKSVNTTFPRSGAASTPARKVAVSTPAPVMAAAKTAGKAAPVYWGPKLEFNEKQKLMLKSQILAYRMMRRNERLQNVVIQAATDKNFKNSNFPKSDLNLLSSLFKKEYSK